MIDSLDTHLCNLRINETNLYTHEQKQKIILFNLIFVHYTK